MIAITCTVFNELLAEDNIRTFIYGVCPFVSEEETKQEEEYTKLDRDAMDKEETDIEGHDEEDTNTKEHDDEIERKNALK